MLSLGFLFFLFLSLVTLPLKRSLVCVPIRKTNQEHGSWSLLCPSQHVMARKAPPGGLDRGDRVTE